MKELIVASRNKGKVGEIKELLANLPFKVTSLLDYPHIPEIIEDGKTYRANALKKAREVALATGKMAMSDDSGIEVKALGNAPGIYSARFAGEGASEKARNKKLFAMLKRRAFAQTSGALPLCDSLGRCQGQGVGRCAGHLQRLCHHPDIGNNGFGFDPLFLLKRYNKTFGQLPPELKAKISHRARALKKFRLLLKKATAINF